MSYKKLLGTVKCKCKYFSGLHILLSELQYSWEEMSSNIQIIESVAWFILMVFVAFLVGCIYYCNKILLEWRRDDIIPGGLSESEWRSNFKFLCLSAFLWLLFCVGCMYLLFMLLFYVIIH